MDEEGNFWKILFSPMNGCAGCTLNKSRGHHSLCGLIEVYVNDISLELCSAQPKKMHRTYCNLVMVLTCLENFRTGTSETGVSTKRKKWVCW